MYLKFTLMNNLKTIITIGALSLLVGVTGASAQTATSTRAQAIKQAVQVKRNTIKKANEEKKAAIMKANAEKKEAVKKFVQTKRAIKKSAKTASTTPVTATSTQ